MPRLCLLLCLSACSPTLRDGVYFCTNDSECPPGWFCHSGMTCHSTPEQTNQREFGAPCSDNSECLEGVCDRGPEGSWPTGFCSRYCTFDGFECPESGCNEWGTCAVPCFLVGIESGESCPAPGQCAVWYYDHVMGPLVGRCVADPSFFAPVPHQSCAVDDDCLSSYPGSYCTFFGTGGLICARPCQNGYIGCGPGEECVYMGDNAFESCVVPCSSSAECGDPGTPNCADPQGAGVTHCVP